ncbi:hypothetical protein L2E82_19781 [Cichorium intybus]|uniref:Uncharacterized protein n=1 Tax=Cichorium intybus TaxID=13427 RepID=A0ACB9DR53_CICIN|nr:hypothetical protein L2E82_19781 [Cichorium intybus]
MDALNSGHLQPNTPPSAQSPEGNMDLMYGSDKQNPPQQPRMPTNVYRDQPVYNVMPPLQPGGDSTNHDVDIAAVSTTESCHLRSETFASLQILFVYCFV